MPSIKPDPSLCVLALEKLNLPPKFVVAFEDSVVGVTSSKNAGVGSVLGVLNREDNNTEEALAVEKGKIFVCTHGSHCTCMSMFTLVYHLPLYSLQSFTGCWGRYSL